MDDFENSFTTGDQFIKEYSNSWMWHRQMPWYIRIELVTLLVLGILMMRFSLSHSDSLYGLCYIVFSVAVPVIIVINARSAIKIYQQRNTILKLTEECHTAIHNDECVVYAKKDKDNPRFPLSAVIDHFESKNYFYLIFTGMLMLPFSKNGFTVGTSDQFRSMMKGLPKKKNTRIIVIGIVLAGVIAAAVFLLIREIQIYKSVGWILPMVNSMRQ